MRFVVNIVVAVILSVVFVACGYDDFGVPDLPRMQAVVPNTDIKTLRDLYFGNEYTVSEDVVIEGCVTANDESGNLYRSFIIQDSSAAVEIYAGTYDLHNAFRVGQMVAVSLEGCAVSQYRGVMRIGRPSSDWDAGYVKPFGVRAILDRYVYRSAVMVAPEAKVINVNEFSETLCGMLICVRNVRLAEGESSVWFEESDFYDASMCLRKFVTATGAEVFVATSRYADFAENTIENGVYDLTGVLYYGEFGSATKRYVIMLRNENDAELK